MKSIKVEGGNVPGWWIFVLKSVSLTSLLLNIREIVRG